MIKLVHIHTRLKVSHILVLKEVIVKNNVAKGHILPQNFSHSWSIPLWNRFFHLPKVIVFKNKMLYLDFDSMVIIILELSLHQRELEFVFVNNLFLLLLDL